MEPGEQLKAIVDEAETSGIGSSVILVGPHGSGKTHHIKQLISSFNYLDVVHFPGALARPALCPDPQTALLRLLPQSSALTSISMPGFEEYFSNRKSLLILVMEELDLFGGGISEQAFLYSLFELALSHPLIILATTCRQKRVKSRFGYNIISLRAPSYEEFKSRFFQPYEEEELKQRYAVSTDPRLSLSLYKTSMENDFCLAETLVLTCIIKMHSQSLYFTPQAVFQEYAHTVKPQLEAMSMLRPLTLGQFCRAFESLISKGIVVDRKEHIVEDFMLKSHTLAMPAFWLQEKLQSSEPFVQRILQN